MQRFAGNHATTPQDPTPHRDDMDFVTAAEINAVAATDRELMISSERLPHLVTTTALHRFCFHFFGFRLIFCCRLL